MAIHLNLSWNTVKEMVKDYLERNYSKPDITGLKVIGIDEFAVKKGRVYKTIVVNLETGQIVYVGDGKGADALDGFWKLVNKAGVKIEAMDTLPLSYPSPSPPIPLSKERGCGWQEQCRERHQVHPAPQQREHHRPKGHRPTQHSSRTQPRPLRCILPQGGCKAHLELRFKVPCIPAAGCMALLCQSITDP